MFCCSKYYWDMYRRSLPEDKDDKTPKTKSTRRNSTIIAAIIIIALVLIFALNSPANARHRGGFKHHGLQHRAFKHHGLQHRGFKHHGFTHLNKSRHHGSGYHGLGNYGYSNYTYKPHAPIGHTTARNHHIRRYPNYNYYQKHHHHNKHHKSAHHGFSNYGYGPYLNPYYYTYGSSGVYHNPGYYNSPNYQYYGNINVGTYHKPYYRKYYKQDYKYNNYHQHDYTKRPPSTQPAHHEATAAHGHLGNGSLLNTGLHYFKNRDYPRASKTLEQAVLAEPHAGVPKLAFGDALFASGNYDYAAYALQRGIARINNLPFILAHRQNLFSNPHELERLKYKLHHYAQQNPSNENANFLLGYYNCVTGRYADADRYLNKALKINKDNHAAAQLRNLVRNHMNE
ncbi:MAG: tetratricopeptide repeat protein [Planctomycetota bacterium]|jgi:hypothetical protein